MQLKITTSIKRAIITVEIETINFTNLENKMLDQFGEPVFDFEEVYAGEFAVSIHKKIRTNFKVKVRFDGTKDIDKASLAVNTFIYDVKEKVPVLIEDFMDKVELIDLNPGTDIVTITENFIPPVMPRYPNL